MTPSGAEDLTTRSPSLTPCPVRACSQRAATSPSDSDNVLAKHRIREVLTAPHSPWQNPFVERLIGSVRRECLDHVLVLNECHLRRILTRYFAYYHRARTHLALDKDAPDGRPIERPALGTIVSIPEVGGLHHRYVRRAA